MVLRAVNGLRFIMLGVLKVSSSPKHVVIHRKLAFISRHTGNVIAIRSGQTLKGQYRFSTCLEVSIKVYCYNMTAPSARSIIKARDKASHAI